jgi:hypothetical protein
MDNVCAPWIFWLFFYATSMALGVFVGWSSSNHHHKR